MPLIHHCLRKNFVFAFAFLTVILCELNTVVAFRQQTAGVRGFLMCGDKPAGNVKVKLMDKDTGIDPDDELGAGYTDANGFFELYGNTMETTNIDPQLKIYHSCNKGLNPCPIKWVIDIPDKYIYAGTQPPKKFFDLGRVNMEVELESQSFDCIH